MNVIQHEANDKPGSLMFHEKKKKRGTRKAVGERRRKKSIKVKQTGRKKARPETTFFTFVYFRIVGKSTEKNINYDAVWVWEGSRKEKTSRKIFTAK